MTGVLVPLATYSFLDSGRFTRLGLVKMLFRIAKAFQLHALGVLRDKKDNVL